MIAFWAAMTRRMEATMLARLALAMGLKTLFLELLVVKLDHLLVPMQILQKAKMNRIGKKRGRKK
jgi:hypothetical protein